MRYPTLTLVLIGCLLPTLTWGDDPANVDPAPLSQADQSLRGLLSTEDLEGVSRMHGILRELIHAQISGSLKPLVQMRTDTGLDIGQSYLIRGDRIVVDLTVHGNPEQALDTLREHTDVTVLGVASTPTYSIISIASAAEDLLFVSRMPQLAQAMPAQVMSGRVEHQSTDGPPASVRAQGLADNQAEAALEIEAVRRVFTNLDGTGISIGTLSDSANQLGGGIASSQATGDLPGNAIVSVLADGNSTNGDEGRAMMELIHDIAPSLSSLSFATAFGGQATFANNIALLANAGMDIINDDVVHFSEPYYQDGVVAQAVSNFINQGGIYYALNHNFANLSYENTYNDSNGNGRHNYAANDSFMQITVGRGTVANPRRISIGLQWAQPWGSATSDLDLQLWNAGFTGLLGTGGSVNNIGGNPIERVSLQNTGAPFTAHIAVRSIAGSTAGLTFKFIIFDNGAATTINEFTNDAAGTLTPHAATPQSIAIGAAPYFNRDAAKAFSGIGPHRRFFDDNGNPVGPFTLTKPDFMSVDESNTTFFGRDIPNDLDTLPNFSGTSAATPNAAAVGALMLQAAGGPGSLDARDIKEYLTMSAIDIGPEGYDLTYGNGRIHALGAVVLAQGGASPETTLYLNQFGDSQSNRNLFATSDVDTFIYSSNNSGEVTVDVREISFELDPMLAVFVPDFSLRIGVDYNSGADVDDARMVFNSSPSFPYLAEVLSESELTSSADFTIEIDAPDQVVVDRSGNLNGNFDDLGINDSLIARGDSDYFQYTAPVSGDLDIDLTPTGFSGLIRLFNDQGTFLEATSVSSGSTGRLNVSQVDAGNVYVIQIVPEQYLGFGNYSLDVNFTGQQFELAVERVGSGSGRIISDGISGINCGSDCNELYPPGTTVALVANANLGDTFIGWQGSCIPTANRCVVLMNASKTISALFAGSGPIFSDGFE